VARAVKTAQRFSVTGVSGRKNNRAVLTEGKKFVVIQPDFFRLHVAISPH